MGLFKYIHIFIKWKTCQYLAIEPIFDPPSFSPDTTFQNVFLTSGQPMTTVQLMAQIRRGRVQTDQLHFFISTFLYAYSFYISFYILFSFVTLFIRYNFYTFHTFRIYTYKISLLRIQDVYPGSRIQIFLHPGSRISDPGSQIQPKRGGTFFLICLILRIYTYKIHTYRIYTYIRVGYPGGWLVFHGGRIIFLGLGWAKGAPA